MECATTGAAMIPPGAAAAKAQLATKMSYEEKQCVTLKQFQ